MDFRSQTKKTASRKAGHSMYRKLRTKEFRDRPDNGQATEDCLAQVKMFREMTSLY